MKTRKGGYMIGQNKMKTRNGGYMIGQNRMKPRKGGYMIVTYRILFPFVMSFASVINGFSLPSKIELGI